VDIGTEASQFPEKEGMNGIFVAVCNIKLTASYLENVKLPFTIYRREQFVH
jgi:hypothetical protein